MIHKTINKRFLLFFVFFNIITLLFQCTSERKACISSRSDAYLPGACEMYLHFENTKDTTRARSYLTFCIIKLEMDKECKSKSPYLPAINGG